jgi:nucleoside-diphosphate-sugar epimerase
VRIAVVGGTGFIGHHVTRWLVEAGAEVSVIHRGRTPVQIAGVRSFKADRKQTSTLATALAAAAPAVVVDMAAYTGEDVETLLTTLPGTLTRLIVISSGDVYWTYAAFLGLSRAGTSALPVDERAPLREQLYPYRAQASGPEDLLYGYEKIVVERTVLRGARVPVTILRLPMVYGPDDPQKRVDAYLRRLEANAGMLRINAVEAAWRCTRGYVEDVAWAIQLAALDERAADEIFNVGEAEVLTELEWIREIAMTASWSGQVVSDPATPPSLPVEWGTPLIVDTRRIRQVLGYQEPIGRQEGLRRTLADATRRASPGGAA